MGKSEIKQEVRASQIWPLPKVDLHLHLDTSLRPDTAIELAKPRKVPVKKDDDLIVPMDCGSLMNYLKRIDLALDILQDEESLFRCAQELAEDLCTDGVIYAEIRFAPELHTRKGLDERKIVEIIWNGLGKGQYKNLRTRLIICALRHVPLPHSLKAARLALDCRDLGVVALDLAGDENSLNTADFKPAFDLVLAEGLPTIVHAGEARGPESIWGALKDLNATRIGHGVRALEDNALMKYLKEKQICIETCPTSNVVTSAVKSFDAHPLKKFLDYGLRVRVNTDASTTVRTTMTDELMLMAKHQGLSLKQVAQLLINGFESGFDVGPVKKQALEYLRGLL